MDSRALTVVAIVFWASIGLILYAHAGYPVLLGLLAWLRRRRPRVRALPDDELPAVSVIVAAYAEEDVIAERVANIRALDYPSQLVEVIVACDGSAGRDRGSGPVGRRRRRTRTPARGQDPGPGRWGGEGPQRGRGLLGRQRELAARGPASMPAARRAAISTSSQATSATSRATA